jgi:hypothetical protein
MPEGPIMNVGPGPIIVRCYFDDHVPDNGRAERLTVWSEVELQIGEPVQFIGEYDGSTFVDGWASACPVDNVVRLGWTAEGNNAREWRVTALDRPATMEG